MVRIARRNISIRLLPGLNACKPSSSQSGERQNTTHFRSLFPISRRSGRMIQSGGCMSTVSQQLFLLFYSQSNTISIVITVYCPIQTLYKDVRHNSLLQGIPFNPPREFMAAVFCVASLYVSGLDSHNLEMRYLQQVIKFLQKTVHNTLPDSEIGFVAGIIRLLI